MKCSYYVVYQKIVVCGPLALPCLKSKIVEEFAWELDTLEGLIRLRSHIIRLEGDDCKDESITVVNWQKLK